MATELAAPPLTYEDYRTIPDDRHRHEIVDGEEYVSSAPTTPQRRIVRRLLISLSLHVEEQGLGEVFDAPCDVLLSETDIVQPDVLFVAAERSNIVKERGIEGAPDLIAEIVSEGNRRHDEIRTRKLDARHDVPEYWVVDPALETVKVYREPDGGYKRVAEWTAEHDDALSTPLLPDWSLPLKDLFRTASQKNG
ncbi:MAG: Uma2 family endonuclease [Salinibacter sp.]|uniref:Uma2 family endonuclease n=1 Tax=Salinibacter sp. TaxID=2065818 RepID=UPI0035D48B1E